jgi:hypothetical protein
MLLRFPPITDRIREDFENKKIKLLEMIRLLVWGIFWAQLGTKMVWVLVDLIPISLNHFTI